MSICIFPGTFNPIHNAHLQMAEFALKYYGFEKIIFIPAYIPPHKELSSNLAKHRYKMVEVPVNSALRKKLENKDIGQLEKILRSYPEHHMHNKTDLDTPQRAIRAIEIAEYYSKHGGRDSSVPPLNPVIIGIAIDRDTRRKRITDRLHARLKEGMIDEVRGLLDSGIKPEDLIYYGLEYRYITLYLTGQMEYPDMVSSLETAIHQFAKRQMTWFRGMERRGFKIHWINGDKKLPERIEEALAIIQG